MTDVHDARLKDRWLQPEVVGWRSANLNEIAVLLGHRTLNMVWMYERATMSRMHDLVGRMSVASGVEDGEHQ